MADDSSPADLGEALVAAARRLRTASMASLAQWDITPSQLRALRVLDHHGGVRASELAAHLRIAPRSATEVVDALEAKGLARRTPDPADRRAVVVSLTDEGRRVGDQVARARGVESEKMLERLSRTDRAHLSRILRRLQA